MSGVSGSNKWPSVSGNNKCRGVTMRSWPKLYNHHQAIDHMTWWCLKCQNTLHSSTCHSLLLCRPVDSIALYVGPFIAGAGPVQWVKVWELLFYTLLLIRDQLIFLTEFWLFRYSDKCLNLCLFSGNRLNRKIKDKIKNIQLWFYILYFMFYFSIQDFLIVFSHSDSPLPIEYLYFHFLFYILLREL